jgi:protein-S-isoprenylcysteine O-methyltransferase Ste14
MRLFRAAPPTSTRMLLVRTLLQIIVTWTFALVVLPAVAVWVGESWGLTSWQRPITTVIGAACFTASSTLGLWAAWVMVVQGAGTPLPTAAARALVVTGPYRWVRNPMATGGVGQSLGVALMLGSWIALLIPIAGAVVWSTLMRPAEERFLLDRFGDEYGRYRNEVGLWIPRRTQRGRRSRT